MTMEQRIRQHMETCSRRLRALQKKYPGPPKEKLSCYTKNGHDYWRVTDENGKRRHLSLREKPYAIRLIQTMVYWLEILDLKSEIEACNRYLNYIQKHSGKLERFLTTANEAYKNLMHEAFRPEDERLAAWAARPYERSTYKPEQCKIATSQGFMVRSKSEALIAEVLYLLGIPCRYEEVHYINGERFVPDFTVLNPITYKTFFIEYNGMMDDDDYIERHLHKAEVYIRCKLIPDIDMLQFYETKESRIDMRQIRFRIENFVYGNAS